MFFDDAAAGAGGDEDVLSVRCSVRRAAAGSLRVVVSVASGFPPRDLPSAFGAAGDCGTGEGNLQTTGLTQSREGERTRAVDSGAGASMR